MLGNPYNGKTCSRQLMSLKSKFHRDLFFFESGDTEVLKVARDKEVNYLNLLIIFTADKTLSESHTVCMN